MNGKYLGVIIGAVVAIMLVGGVLMPVINEQATTTEQAPAEGAYGPAVGYYTIESAPTTTTNYFVATFDFDDTDEDSVITATFKVNNVQAYNGPLSDLPKMIIYADNNVTIYIDGESVYYSGDVNGSYSIRSDASPTIQIYWKTNAYKYSIGDNVFNQTYGDITYYYAAFVTDGEYSNFLGDNPPTMDTPTVSVAGMYIGPKMTEVPTESPAAPIYLAIPIVILVALLTAVAFVAFRRDY